MRKIQEASFPNLFLDPGHVWKYFGVSNWQTCMLEITVFSIGLGLELEIMHATCVVD
jgi:hypothetical protein